MEMVRARRNVIVRHDRRFHLCTWIGEYLISTVGNDALKKFGYIEVDCDRKYETTVFKVKDCNGVPSELDFNGYTDAKAAMAGHYAMCEKWNRP